jgi:hypothetical protein
MDNVPEPEAEMTKEEKKFLIKALWEALVTPRWTKDELIDFGMAIFSKKPLKEMEEKTFNKILPFLNTMTIKLWQLLGAEAAKQASAPGDKKTEPETKGETTP